MRLSKYEYCGAATAQRMRERMRRYGHPRGYRLWTKSEDEVVRRFYPDYTALQKKLTWRTYNALRSRVRSLGIQRRKPRWTTSEITRLRRLYTCSPVSLLLAEFPGRSKRAIEGQARRRGLRRLRRYVATGNELLDAVRDRCVYLGYTMVDLDAISRTRRYFQTAEWRRHRSINVAHVTKAARALDGELGVKW